MTIMQKLHKIEEVKTIYNIHYCNAGVGISFFDPPEGYKMPKYNDSINKDYWRKYLTVDKYYSTFEECIKAEFKRLIDPS